MINFRCRLMTRVSRKQAPLIVTGREGWCTGTDVLAEGEAVSSPGTLRVQLRICSISRNRRSQLLSTSLTEGLKLMIFILPATVSVIECSALEA